MLQLAYHFATTIRNELFDRKLLKSYQSSLPVISVGNLTTGGNGKTPLCIYIAERLADFGKRPAILMRGYKGHARSAHRVGDQDSIALVGDEAAMLSQKFKTSVFVSKDRVTGAKLIESIGEHDLILLDDGFQHRWLNRNLNIIAVDVSSPDSVDRFLKGELLPTGRFREDRNRAWRRTDAVVFNTRSNEKLSDQTFQDLKTVIPQTIPIFKTSLVLNLELKNKLAVAICGLGNPQGFIKSVSSFGFAEVIQKVFPDHHNFSVAELSELTQQYAKYQMVCSSKDIVRIPLEYRGYFSVLEARLLMDNPAGFDALLRSSF